MMTPASISKAQLSLNGYEKAFLAVMVCAQILLTGWVAMAGDGGGHDGGGIKAECSFHGTFVAQSSTEDTSKIQVDQDDCLDLTIRHASIDGSSSTTETARAKKTGEFETVRLLNGSTKRTSVYRLDADSGTLSVTTTDSPIDGSVATRAAPTALPAANNDVVVYTLQ